MSPKILCIQATALPMQKGDSLLGFGSSNCKKKDIIYGMRLIFFTNLGSEERVTFTFIEHSVQGIIEQTVLHVIFITFFSPEEF